MLTAARYGPGPELDSFEREPGRRDHEVSGDVCCAGRIVSTSRHCGGIYGPGLEIIGVW